MKYILIIASLLILPASSMAAELHLDRNPNAFVREGDVFSIGVSVETGKDIVNAIEGSLQFSPSLILTDIHFKNSLIPLWISSPSETAKGVVSFAGLLPGGYQGNGTLFTLVFKALRKDPRASISFGNDTGIYRNDGLGTKDVSTPPKLLFEIGVALGNPNKVSIEEDTVPPEAFVPIISAGELFDMHNPVLLFTAQDKNSGIARYDIARSYVKDQSESRLSWREVKSPYTLIAGDDTRYLYIRAVDRMGNVRIEAVPPQSFSSIAFVVAWWPLFVFGLGTVLFIWFIRRFERNGAV